MSGWSCLQQGCGSDQFGLIPAQIFGEDPDPIYQDSPHPGPDPDPTTRH
jgi:hypothetical protein